MRTQLRTRHPSTRQLLILAIAATTFSSAAFAQTAVTWVGTTGNYVDPSNWSNNATPANADGNFLSINSSGTALINPGDSAEGAYLNLGLNPGDTGSLNITGGTLTVGELRVGGRETVPDFSAGTLSPTGGGTGSVVQSGGTVSVTYSTGTEPPIQSTYIGDAGLSSGNSAVGSYTISNNALLLNGIANNDQLVIGTGAGTHGSFFQQDTSTVTSTGFVVVARAGATASYTMTGGTLNAQGQNGLWIGDGATLDATDVVPGTTATFTQSGNSNVNIAAAVEVGRRGGTGLYNMSAGSLAVTSQMILGSNGGATTGPMLSSTGTFNLSGSASVSIGTNLNIALSSSTVANTARGSFNMTGGSLSLNAANSILAVGNGDGSSGTLNISAGTLTMNGATAQLDIGRNNSTGLVDLSGTANVSVNELTLDSSTTNTAATRELRIESGTLNVAFWEQGAVTTPVSRVVNMTGGTLNVTSATAAHRAGRNVIYNFSGGSVNFAGNLPIDTSTVNISNTANTTFGNYRTGGVVSGITGTTNITGGSFAATNVNDSGSVNYGNVNISGGTTTVSGAWAVTSGTTTLPGSLTISNGIVSIGSLTTGGSATIHSALNISGGSLSIPSLTLSTGSILTTDNNISLSSSILLGNATANVNTGSLSFTGSLTASSARTLTKTGTGSLTISGSQSYIAGSAITNNAGTLNLNSNANGNLTLNANSATNLNSPQSLAALNVADSVTSSVAAGGSNSLTLSSLNLNSIGTLDLANNPMTLNYTTDPIATIVGYLHSAYNNGSWTGTGLTSSTAAAQPNHITGIGYSDTGSQILTKYTYLGDLNLDGKVNADDYALLDRQVALNGLGSPATWTTGDFNYDGVVDSSDYMLIDTSFAHQSGGLSPDFLAQRESEFGEAYVQQLLTSIPEPSLLAACALALPLLSRRRRATK
jgi:hypothetical protein